LVILDKNPLSNIQNTESIRSVMLNGRLYDADTLNEIGNYNLKRSKFFFEMPGSANAWPATGETFGHQPTCLCGK
jgi:hypothetical protein